MKNDQFNPNNRNDLYNYKKNDQFKPRFKKLHLIRTGGNIQSQFVEYTGFVPTADYIQKYLVSILHGYFDGFGLDESLKPPVDSSNMTLNRIKEIAKIIDQNVTGQPDISEYDDFEERVKLVALSPFETSETLMRYVDEDWKGFILLGYGSGNANIEGCKYSIIDSNSKPLGKCTDSGNKEVFFDKHPCRGFFVDELGNIVWCDKRDAGKFNVIDFVHYANVKNKYVIVTSQVTRGIYDFEYETGLNLIRAGVIPGADMSIPEAQVKLSYILGHLVIVNYKEFMKSILENKYNISNQEVILRVQDMISEYQIVSACMLAGCEFRTRDSKKRYEDLMNELGKPIYIYGENPFWNREC